jgi:hypothetical protein
MSAPRQPKDERLDELLMKGATEGLTSGEANEVVVRGGAYDQSYAVAAAALDLATLRIEPMPASLEARLLAQLESVAPGPGSGSARAEPTSNIRALPRRDWTKWAGWLAAAAMVLLFVGSYARGWLKAPVAVSAPTLAEERARFIASAKDARVLPWTPTKDLAGEHATGDVVWSQSEQKGFMRFRGLASNDRTKAEYQLWIFDQSQEYPVDGGVFDVGPDGEVVVPIHSKLPVGTPTLFAVTVEKPGGVVVSKRERIVVTAEVKAG